MPSPTTAIDLINSSARLAGILASGETLSADEANDALSVLNDVLEQMSTGTISAWQTPNEQFTLTPGQDEYTIGPGGNFDTDRPVQIEAAYTTVNGVDFPVQIIDLLQYNLLSLKTLSEQIVLQMVYINDMPLGRILLWPVPSTAVPFTIGVSRIITPLASLSTPINYPQGAAKFLRYKLAIELAAEFGQEVPSTVMVVYQEAEADYKNANRRQVRSLYDTAIVRPTRAIWQRGY